ncbi:hypothetical protein GGX14DRAFT_406402 [Mycena pura]|uniref:Uncharacterized protein n=1 Tax=Mycena pura TaxID=153505 RepID=A0AAD6Y5K4_9AGAR|nr:hypothetical protein GGX14DRAFT_406402 [Mycena pura]
MEAKSLKSHLVCNAHKSRWINHLEQVTARAADIQEFTEISNAAGVSAFPDFEDITPSYLPPIFEDEDNFMANDRVLSTAELIQELGEVQEDAVPTAEENQSNLRQQYEQMLLDAYQADHLENADGVDDQFISDEAPKNLVIEEDDEDDLCFDPSALSSSAYHPYPSKAAMLLDIMDNFPRCRFTNAHMSLIIQFAKNLGVPNVPSIKALRNIQQSLQSSCGDAPTRIESQQGNIFYMNDIRGIIARDFANPLVSPHMHFYPEETDGPISEVFQAERWTEYAPEQLTPMFTNGRRRFWINEVAQLEDGTFVVPVVLVMRNKNLEADVLEVTQTADRQWRLHTEDLKSIKATDFGRTYDEIMGARWCSGLPCARKSPGGPHIPTPQYCGHARKFPPVSPPGQEFAQERVWVKNREPPKRTGTNITAQCRERELRSVWIWNGIRVAEGPVGGGSAAGSRNGKLRGWK